MKKIGKIKMLTIVSLSVLALSVPIALAQTTGTNQDKHGTREGRQGRGKHWGGHKGGMHGGMFRGLNLTDDQKAKMKQIGQSSRERTQPLRAELKTKRQALRQAGASGTFDEALATQTLTETAGLQAKLMGERFRTRQEMLAVLTPEQKTQLEQKRAEFKARWAERSGRKSE
jgi:protein CpxP